MNQFKVKVTKNYIYLESNYDSAFCYRVSGNLKSFEKYLKKTTLKLIPLLKILDKSSKYTLETKTTQNKRTGEWLWVPGYQRCPEFPKGTVGGLSFNGTLFSGEFSESGRPIMMGRNMNSQNKGALKGMKTESCIEDAENRPKFSESELNALKMDRIRRGIF